MFTFDFKFKLIFNDLNLTKNWIREKGKDTFWVEKGNALLTIYTYVPSLLTACILFFVLFCLRFVLVCLA